MTENVDILDANGKYTGTHVSRAEVHAKGLWHRTVHLWIRNSKGELLIQKRSLSKESHPGLWDISCAGHLSAGDSSREGAVREAREELGITIDMNKLMHLFSIREEWYSTDNTIIDREIKDVFLYHDPVEKKDISIDSDEVAEIRYVSLNEFEKVCFTHRTLYVPHDEEYRKLLRYLRRKETMLLI